jgi:hypothetical protein
MTWSSGSGFERLSQVNLCGQGSALGFGLCHTHRDARKPEDTLGFEQSCKDGNGGTFICAVRYHAFEVEDFKHTLHLT